MRNAVRNGTALVRTNLGALILTLAVALVFFASLAGAESLAEFESRAVTRLFVLAALDTLVGARLVSATRRAKPSTTEAPDPDPPDNPTSDSPLRGVRRHRKARTFTTARHRNPWPSTTNRSGQ